MINPLDHLRLVKWVITKYFWWSRTDPDELFQEGCVALMRAVKQFDPSHNVRFSTYATKAIYWQVHRAANADLTVIHTPYVAWSQLDEAKRKKVQEAQWCRRFTDLGVRNRIHHKSLYAGLDEELAIEEPEVDESTDIVRAAIQKLKERHRVVLEARLRGQNLAQIGKALGITRERARQIEKKALENLKTTLWFSFPAFYRLMEEMNESSRY